MRPLPLLALLALGCAADTSPCAGTRTHYESLDQLLPDDLRVAFVLDGGESAAAREQDVAGMTAMVVALLDGDSDGDGVTDVDPAEGTTLTFARADASCAAPDEVTVDLTSCGGDARGRLHLYGRPDPRAIAEVLRCVVTSLPPSCGPSRAIAAARALNGSYVDADAIVFVSHRDDASREDPTELAAEVAAGYEHWTLGVPVVIGGLPIDASTDLDAVLADPRMHGSDVVCGEAGLAATASPRLLAFARSFDGGARSICAARWAATLGRVIATPLFTYGVWVDLPLEPDARGAVRCEVDLDIAGGAGARYPHCEDLPYDAEWIGEGYEPGRELCRVRQAVDASDARGWQLDEAHHAIVFPGSLHRHGWWPNATCVEVQSTLPLCGERWWW